MVKEITVDVKENSILKLDSTLLDILLKDNSSGKNILWATDDYVKYNLTEEEISFIESMIKPME